MYCRFTVIEAEFTSQIVANPGLELLHHGESRRCDEPAKLVASHHQ